VPFPGQIGEPLRLVHSADPTPVVPD
jgi:hypothetical protein